MGMKRLCIYVTYDPENIVDGYIGHTLSGIRKVVDSLVVVCNYGHIAGGMENIEPYADKIFYRENRGFDAGAYKDALCRYLGWDVVRGYDGILLANDSFYGSMHPLGELFARMEKTNADYWGMTRCPETELADGNIYGSHIQSYFLSFGSAILQSKAFRDFWEDMEYPESFIQAVVRYEIGINRLLQGVGFTGTTVMEQGTVQWNLRKNENPHILYPLELIRDAGVPILKRKSLSISNGCFGNALEALKFIRDKCNYDVNLIENHLKRIGKGRSIAGLDVFYAGHVRIFIYGAGLYGRNIAMYIAYKGWSFEGFLVTNKEECSMGCIPFTEAEIGDSDGIVIAVGDRKAFLEILRLVETRCRRDQIFNPDDIIW